MMELLFTIVGCWLLVAVCKMMFRLAWCTAKVFALVLTVFAAPILLAGLLLASGVLLLLPVGMLVIALLLVAR